jgi:hypothetical protein
MIFTHRWGTDRNIDGRTRGGLVWAIAIASLEVFVFVPASPRGRLRYVNRPRSRWRNG